MGIMGLNAAYIYISNNIIIIIIVMDNILLMSIHEKH
ncbi:hypothetical protein MPF_1149 [Methanohalophilus portucalensis FDF-1]|uniref:Uncharacterized protein n=1 Tax=Methanohalophilus portucalensis FDF-1 TaxID=523843 RepID=A0A1L9C433_9EURY|nr:hypothetical protein MPF_1149 [Methanohalophilus portucalensis FDF-1]